MSLCQYWHLDAIFGYYLQFAGEVLSVVLHQTVEQAEKNATRNSIKNVQYFGGSSVEALPQIAEKISCDKACAVVICSSGKYLWMLCVMFSHWRFKPSGMCQCVASQVIFCVSEDHGAFIFRVKTTTNFALYTSVGRLLYDASGDSKIWKSARPSCSFPPNPEDEGRHCDSSICWELPT